MASQSNAHCLAKEQIIAVSANANANGHARQRPRHDATAHPNVGNTAAFLCSDLAAGITGEIIYVDGGYNNLGMTFEID